MSVRLNPILPATSDAILVGDPRRAFALGQSLTVQPAMSHLSRGLWGYRGETAAGLELTVQATGVGGPSAVAVISDLVDSGVKRLIRLGTCTATGADHAGEAIRPGQAFLVSRARCGDGASRALSGGEDRVLPDPGLFDALGEVAQAAEVFSHDLLPRMDERAPGGTAQGEDRPDGPPDAGAAREDQTDPERPAALQAPLRDLQTAATLAVARRLGVEAAAVLVVAEDPAGKHLDEKELEEILAPLARSIAEVLEAISNPQVKG
jgi:uridine phosphorylase